MKTEADMAVAREQQAASQLKAENRTLLQQVATLNQKALDYAHLNRAHQLLQAQFDALRAENTIGGARRPLVTSYACMGRTQWVTVS